MKWFYKLLVSGIIAMQVLSCQSFSDHSKISNELVLLNCELVEVCLRDSSASSDEYYPFCIIDKYSLAQRNLFLAPNSKKLLVTQSEKDRITKLFYQCELSSIELFHANKILYVLQKKSNYFGVKKHLYIYEGNDNQCNVLDCWSRKQTKKSYF